MRVTLTLDEMKEAHRIGFFRATSETQTIDRSVQKLSWHENIARDAEAVGAEMAVAKFLGIPEFRPTLDGFKNVADIGGNFEVKWTKWVDGSLILSERDRKEDIAILVTGTAPILYIRGWIPVAVARRERQKRSDGSWWINQSDLHPIQNLMRSSYGNPTL